MDHFPNVRFLPQPCKTTPCFPIYPLNRRSSLGGNFSCSDFARVGRSINSPPQLGQTSSSASAHGAQ